MLILRTLPASPYGRKVAIAVLVLGLEDRVNTEAADLDDPLDSLRQQNPLGKIPALVLEDGSTLYDSRVIIAYLDHLSGGDRIVPAKPEARFEAMRLEALADGLTDAALLQIYEKRYRLDDERSQGWVDRQANKVRSALDHLEAQPPQATGAPTVGTIALAAALGYLDFRFEGAWRREHPNLAAWLEAFRAAVPAFDATTPSG